jgi:hypothetical protein
MNDPELNLDQHLSKDDEANAHDNAHANTSGAGKFGGSYLRVIMVAAAVVLVAVVLSALFSRRGGAGADIEEVTQRYADELSKPTESQPGMMILGSGDLTQKRTDFVRGMASASAGQLERQLKFVLERFDPNSSNSCLYTEADEPEALEKYDLIVTAAHGELDALEKAFADSQRADVQARLRAAALFQVARRQLPTTRPADNRQTSSTSVPQPAAVPDKQVWADLLEARTNTYLGLLEPGRFLSPRAHAGAGLNSRRLAREDLVGVLYGAAARSDVDLNKFEDAVARVRATFDRDADAEETLGKVVAPFRPTAIQLARWSASTLVPTKSLPAPPLSEPERLFLLEIKDLCDALSVERNRPDSDRNYAALRAIDELHAFLKGEYEGWLRDVPLGILVTWEQVLARLQITEEVLEEEVPWVEANDQLQEKTDAKSKVRALSDSLSRGAESRWSKLETLTESLAPYERSDCRYQLLRAYAWELVAMKCKLYADSCSARTGSLRKEAWPKYPIDDDFEDARRQLQAKGVEITGTAVGTPPGRSLQVDLLKCAEHCSARMAAVGAMSTAVGRLQGELRVAREQVDGSWARLRNGLSESEQEKITEAKLWQQLQDQSGPGKIPDIFALLAAERKAKRRVEEAVANAITAAAKNRESVERDRNAPQQ